MDNAPAADPGTLNFLWAWHLVDGFAAAGVGHAVISPGARSTPLALACLRHPALTAHVRIDERGAAFFALGLAKADGRPVIVVCTSGSAPGHWLPATIEADAAGVPLLLLSADRPPEVHGWGANQTVDQLKLFGSHVRASHTLGTPDAAVPPRLLRQLAARAAEQSRWPLPGPVHLNLPFREPLVPPADVAPPAVAPGPVVTRPVAAPDGEAVFGLIREISGRPGVIVCGEGPYGRRFASLLAALAHRLGCPILAEPLSGLRFGPHDQSRVCSRQEAFLRNPDFAASRRPEWVLRFGAFPVSRSVQEWLAANAGARHVINDAAGRWPDPLGVTSLLLRSDPEATCAALLAGSPMPASDDWFAAFADAERRAAGLAASACAAPEAFEGAIVHRLVAALPDGARLFVGNSMAIRDFDAFSGTGARPIGVFGNRGASGIDGNLATAAGLAADGRPTAALIGDLAAHHDVNSLEAVRGRPLVAVVVNNGGGAIFGHLPQAGLPEFERAWLTTAAVDLRAAAAAWGIAYARADTNDGFTEAVTAALASAVEDSTPTLVEVVIDRSASLARHRAYWQAVTASPL